MTKILITNNGTHPPEKWAMITAETIFDISSVTSEDRLLQARKLQVAIAEALMPHHAHSQHSEKENLKSDVSSIHSELDGTDIDHVMADIITASKKTSWEDHFMKPEVQEVMREIVDNHIRTARHVERLWHADRNPDCKVSQQYKARFHS